METTQASTNKWINKMWSSHTREYLAIQRQSTDTGYNMEEPLWRKTQDHILQDPITIKCPEEANQETEVD